MMKILFGIMGLAILVLKPPLFAFLAVALAPSIVASIVDRVPGKNISTTVLLFNLSGVSIYAFDILERFNSLSGIKAVLDPYKLLVVYLFAAFGWFVVWIIPRITIIIVEYKNENRSHSFKKKLYELEEEWGEEIRS